jgi:choline-glycine betaine transporter
VQKAERQVQQQQRAAWVVVVAVIVVVVLVSNQLHALGMLSKCCSMGCCMHALR